MAYPSCLTSFLAFSICLLACLGSISAADGEAASATVGNSGIDFARDIYPVLQRTCFECHGELKQAGGLRLDRRDDLLNSGTVEPGVPEASELLRRVALPRGHADVMPAVGEVLASQQVQLLRRWIALGAEWPEAFEAPAHWSYVAPLRPALPPVQHEHWIANPLDRFVLHRMEAEGFRPSPAAEPAKRLRRLFLDLIGLPPSPAEVAAFVARPTPDHWEAIVDELLQRPQFGERWARPWLDLARYADSHGFQRDDLRDNWAYRDWVIAALNQDMPFDQFTIEQLAGDLLPGATESQKIATGFHRCAATNVEAGSLPEETRVEQVIDRVNTTAAIWLGSTLECCQCHDHKYDPFTHEEYYRLLAFFNSTALEADLTKPDSPSSIQFQGPSMPLADPQRDAARTTVQAQLDQVQQQLAHRQRQLETELVAWSQELHARSQQQPQVHELTILEFTSQGTTDSFKSLEDGSILLVGGDPPDRDTYRVRARVDCAPVSGFRLDVLRHASLPGGGPGRGDAKRRNFVLNEFEVHLHAPSRGSEGSESQSLTFASAKAGFSQRQFEVAQAIDGDTKSGWAVSPAFDQDHWATFELAEPMNTQGAELQFTLHQSFGQARSIGCFRLSAITGTVHQPTIDGELLKVVAQPSDQWSEQDRQVVLAACVAQDAACIDLKSRIQGLEQELADVAPYTTLVMVELSQPRTTTTFLRGNYKTPGEVVTAGTPAALHPLPGPPLPEEVTAGGLNRLALARWLVSRQNPLVARATVNRWWAELFGAGIVPTVEDFGAKGEPPSHPELLDWLAVEFMEQGWSLKRLLKTIVLSKTYQQSSRITAELAARDDQNRWLARGPRMRMEAEMVRDNALHIAGLLNLKPAGPPIRPPQPSGIWTKVGGQAYDYQVSPGAEQYRRGVYVVIKRGAPYPSFINFDATPRLACTVQRSRTNTPLQALTLLNDPVYVAAAEGLAERVRAECQVRPLSEQLAYAFQLCVARQPLPAESQTLLELYQSQLSQPAHCLESGLTLSGEVPPKGQTPFQTEPSETAERNAWRSVAMTLLNLHETITKD